MHSNRKSDLHHQTLQGFFCDNTNIEVDFPNQPADLAIGESKFHTSDNELSEKVAQGFTHSQASEAVIESTLAFNRFKFTGHQVSEREDTIHSQNHSLRKGPEEKIEEAAKGIYHKVAAVRVRVQESSAPDTNRDTHTPRPHGSEADFPATPTNGHDLKALMTSDSPKSSAPENQTTKVPAHHRPLVVGLRKPASLTNIMASSDQAAALNREIEQNVASNTKAAAPAEDNSPAESAQPKQKKEKAPKQPKAPKAAPAAAPTTPALIDLRVGHILRAIAHPNADSLYVSTIAMGDPEGTEHTHTDEETGKVVRTVCSGLNGLVPLAEMQDRKVIVVANLKPVNMRSIKSAAMVLAASPKQEEGADPHAPDRVVELVVPPADSAAGDKVYFEGWPYGDGRGPEKTLNPKKKQWEAIQPGFYTGGDLVVGFDASKCDEVSGSDKGNLIVDGKGVCVVKTLKGAVVR